MFDLNLIISSLITISTCYFAYYTYKIYKLREKYKHLPGPPTNGILGFYFGNTFQVVSMIRSKNIMLIEVMEEWYKLIKKVLLYTTKYLIIYLILKG
jgi:hypothetical protein